MGAAGTAMAAPSLASAQDRTMRCPRSSLPVAWPEVGHVVKVGSGYCFVPTPMLPVL